tara:strand:+ start:87227 stop:87406 length:180 start_codon:yes stop_codon:yes gene_type:complete
MGESDSIAMLQELVCLFQCAGLGFSEAHLGVEASLFQLNKNFSLIQQAFAGIWITESIY